MVGRLFLRLRRPDLPESCGYYFGYKVAHVVPERRNLTNASGADEHKPQIAHQIDLLDLGSHVLVHERLVELDREVRDCTQTPHDDISTAVSDEVSEQPVELLNGHRRHVVDAGLEHRAPLRGREQGVVRRSVVDRDHQVIEQPRRPTEDVEMTIGHGIESAGIDGDHPLSVADTIEATGIDDNRRPLTSYH